MAAKTVERALVKSENRPGKPTILGRGMVWCRVAGVVAGMADGRLVSGVS